MKRYLNITHNGIHVGKKPTKRHFVVEVELDKPVDELEVTMAVFHKAEQDKLIEWENVALFDGDEDYRWVLGEKGIELFYGKTA